MKHQSAHLIAAERLGRLHPPFSSSGWERDDFLTAAHDGERRWSEAEELFGLQWPMFSDAVSVICPSFGLESKFADIVDATQVPGGELAKRVVRWFMNWAGCPGTADYPNPYEPWIEILEHGGGVFHVEHGLFVDLYDAVKRPLGAIGLRRL